MVTTVYWSYIAYVHTKRGDHHDAEMQPRSLVVFDVD